MKFYNRVRELRLIERVMTGNGTKVILLKGIRQIGKTSLAIESLKGKEYAYIFVPKDKSPGLFLEEMSKELNIPRFSSISDFMRYVFERYEYVFFDEFQNFYHTDKSAYSDIQKLIDEYKAAEKRLCMFFAGSSYSLIKKIFSDYSKALYGRRDLEITLDELEPKAVFQMLEDQGIKDTEEKIKFWAVFGGLPRHYSLIGRLSPKSFDELMELQFSDFRSMLDEGNSMLVSEFGGEYKTYFTVMEAIACGKTTLSEIASVFDDNSTMANRYIDILRREYHLISKINPVITPLKSRRGIYSIKNNYLRFWFRFVKRYESYHEQGMSGRAYSLFKQDFNTYMGTAFEKLCLEALKEGFGFEVAGRQWGRFNGEKGKNTYEIDIVGLKEPSRQITFAECKWQDDVDAADLANRLREKSKHVPWNPDNRKESYMVFAKSFSKKTDDKDVICYDLQDIETILKKAETEVKPRVER
ncbi:MAG: ATP-binding protein [Candidatus Altiarchaeota archaeon]